MDLGKPVTIGRTELRLPRVGLGTGSIGGWPVAVDEDVALATVGRALQHGFRYFDTAPLYGFGLAEQRLAKALSHTPRAGYALSTKVGRVLDPGEPDRSFFKNPLPYTANSDYSAEGVLRSLDESRARLGVDGIDIVLVHDPETPEQEWQARREALPLLADLRSRDEVQAIGVGMNWAEPLARFADGGLCDCLLLAGRYTLLEQGALDSVMPAAERNDTSIILGGVFNSGILIDPSPGATYNYASAPSELLARARAIADVCASFDVPLRAAALHFPLAHPAVATVVVGARSPAEVDDLADLIECDIPPRLWHELKARELLRSDAPTP